jgi:hypothetical protein
MKALTRKDLDAAECGAPGCDHKEHRLYLVGICHPGAPTKTLYDKSTGELVIECAVCEAPIVSIAVAGGETVH